MQNDQFCMFCYYRNKRLAACAHMDDKPKARHDAVSNAAATVPSAVAARTQAPLPRARRPR